MVTEHQLCFALKAEFLLAEEEKEGRTEKLQDENFAVGTIPKYYAISLTTSTH